MPSQDRKAGQSLCEVIGSVHIVSSHFGIIIIATTLELYFCVMDKRASKSSSTRRKKETTKVVGEEESFSLGVGANRVIPPALLGKRFHPKGHETIQIAWGIKVGKMATV